MRQVRTFCCVLTLAVFAGLPCHAVTVEIGPSKDNTMFSEDGDLSNGGGQYLFAGNIVIGPARRALLEFDFSAPPVMGEINNVTLTLHMSRTIVGPQECRLHRVSTEWGEAGSDAPGQEGTGTQAENGDATWTDAFWPATPWNTPGGDFKADASATQIVDGIGFYSWSSPDLILDVAGFVALPEEDHGWILICDEGTTPSAKRFDSRENPNESLRPVLTVEFTPPPDVPATSGSGLALLTLVLMTIGALVVKRLP